MNIGSFIETLDVIPIDPFDLPADEVTELESLEPVALPAS
jgi:hypothetical protein